MGASHKTHRPHIKVGKDEEEDSAINLLFMYIKIQPEALGQLFPFRSVVFVHSSSAIRP